VRIIRSGARGRDVRDVQQRLGNLGYKIDAAELVARYGEATEAAVRAFQQQRGLLADGIVGPETWGELVEAGYHVGDRTLYLRYPYFRGDDVRALQRRLNALGFDAWREDGIFGEHVNTAVREFQRNVGREPDGIVGPETYEALERLRPDVEAPSRALVREAASIREPASLEGAVIALDPGHGPSDPGFTGPGGLEEFDAAFRFATELAQELERRGAKPAMLRASNENPSTSQRAKAANALGAAACVSLHFGGGDAAAEGATCTYFGTSETFSPAGQRLAELIQEELTSRVGLADLRAHPMAFAILRETRMPAVQAEPCFITNEREERLLGEDAFVRDLAVAIAIGLERFLGAQETAEAS